MVTANAILLCLLAPRAVGQRGIARLQALFASGYFHGSFAGLDQVLAGAAPYVRGDYAAAAKAWRALTMHPGGWEVQIFGTPLVDAFEHAGEPELAISVDTALVAKRGRYNGIDPAYARGALRASKRGDKETAKRLANDVIAAWQGADEPVPAVAEMRKLVARLESAP
jgi:hypothetical protein